MTSCSNNSSDNTKPEEETEVDEDLLEGWTAITVGDIEKYDGQEGTVSYTVTKNNNGSITISHDAPMALYASCSFKPNFGDSNTLYTKITNNSDVAATVEVQVSKAGTKDNGWQPTPAVVAVYIDGEKHTDGVEYSKEYKLEPNASVVIVNKFDLAKNPDMVTITLNSQEKVAGTVEKGKITVSGISMKKVTDDSELENPGDGNQGGGQTPGDDDETEEDPVPPNKDEPEDPETPSTLPEKVITFSVSENSTNDENTILMFKYDRSAAGANELVTIEDCGIVVQRNGITIKTIDTLVFALDEYGASFSDDDKDPVTNADNMKEYKTKVSLGTKVAKNDELIVYYNEEVGNISGEGKDADAVKSLVVALIDTAEEVNWYKELVADGNYQPLFPEDE